MSELRYRIEGGKAIVVTLEVAQKTLSASVSIVRMEKSKQGRIEKNKDFFKY